MKFSKHSAKLPSFQITPMIDVVFLLLCFFVTTSVYSQWESEVNIQLPTADASTTPQQRMPGEIIINLDADGVIRVNQRVLTLEELGERCRVLAQNFSGQPVVLRADKRTAYEHVLAVMNTCVKADVWNISFATEMGSGTPARTAADDEPPPATVH